MPATRLKSQLMSGSEIDRTLVRLAHEVVEKNEALDRLAIIGIHRRGAVLGERLAGKIRAARRPLLAGRKLGHYALPRRPVPSRRQACRQRHRHPFEITGKDVILVDDVLYTAGPPALPWTRYSTTAGRAACNYVR